MAFTIEYIILAILVLVFLYLVFHQYLYDKTPIRSVPYARGRPYLLDATKNGYLAEIEKVEDRGSGKIRIYCDNGERRTYEANSIRPISNRHNIAGVGRAIYIYDEKSEKTDSQSINEELTRLETELRRYKQQGRELIEEHLDTSRRITEAGKPSTKNTRDADK